MQLPRALDTVNRAKLERRSTFHADAEVKPDAYSSTMRRTFAERLGFGKRKPKR